VKKIAVVTGGTRGIGRAITLKLARAGYKTFALFAANSEAAAELEKMAAEENLEVVCLRGNLTKESAFESTVGAILEGAPNIDCIVHSAASGVHREAMKISAKEMTFTFETNVLSIHNLLLRLVDRIPRGGRIIGLSSQGARRALSNYAAIGASKGALEALFRHYAKELAPRGIAVNLVSPGLVLTEALNAFPDKAMRIKFSGENTPSGRLTTPEDVADLVGFLALSPAAAQIQGQTIAIDGGISL
jgi:enoyl-[acyl-carrier protein] reductase III